MKLNFNVLLINKFSVLVVGTLLTLEAIGTSHISVYAQEGGNISEAASELANNIAPDGGAQGLVEDEIILTLVYQAESQNGTECQIFVGVPLV